jgi:hypothetical protein
MSKIMQTGFHLDMVRCDKESGQPLHIFKIPHCSIFNSGAFEFGIGDIGKIDVLIEIGAEIEQPANVETSLWRKSVRHHH